VEREAGGRPLGHSERAILLLDRAACLNLVVVAELSGPLASEAVRSGLDAAQARHPLALGRGSPVSLRGEMRPPVGEDLGFFALMARSTHRGARRGRSGPLPARRAAN